MSAVTALVAVLLPGAAALPAIQPESKEHAIQPVNSSSSVHKEFWPFDDPYS